ncbi:MAG TPA: helix-hairpin-helix domain-containing protein [Draconibacterium sp.]|nr:helix-hairpin-helix domain-containing protein [Draconibacterium sp.]
MSRIFSQWFKRYNDFSKGDRTAIITLGSVIMIIITGGIIVKSFNPKSKYDYTQIEQLFKELETPKSNQPQSKKSLFEFDPNTASAEMLDSLNLPEFVKANIINYRIAGGQFSTPLEVRKIYGMNDSIFDAISSFIIIPEKGTTLIRPANNEKRINRFIDPNSADIKQLVDFGFSSFQSNNIVEYRKKGGVFKKQSDLLKIYGIDSAFFELIENHLRIEVEKELIIENNSQNLFWVELNSADSTDLMKLNGIGSVYAGRILKYRDLLGGFYSPVQLLEVYNFPEETYKNIEASISADTLLLKKIRLNFAEYVDLLRHPYLNKQQVEAVLNYRDQNGSYQNIKQLEINGLIDSETFSRISPYLTCR